MKPFAKAILRTSLLLLSAAVAILLSAAAASAQSHRALAREIDSMAARDQHWRELYMKMMNGEADSSGIESVRRAFRETDSSNLVRLRALKQRYGFPGYAMIGKASTHSFWLLVQHADEDTAFQRSMLPLMKRRVDKKDAAADDYAYLVDRVRTNAGELQVYGTQLRINAEKTSFEPFPVEDPAGLDERRRAIGWKPMQEYISELNERYRGMLQSGK